jgi:hypothetical protein
VTATTPAAPLTQDGSTASLMCTAMHPVRDGDRVDFVFHLRSEPPFPTLVEVTSNDRDRYHVGDHYTLNLHPGTEAGLPARRTAPTVTALWDGLVGNLGAAAPVLLAVVMDIVAACETHRANGSRAVPVRAIDEAIAWRLRDYLPRRDAAPRREPLPADSDTQTPT